MTQRGVLAEIAMVVMGQSPNGERVNRDGVGLPLLNGPTEFTGRHPIATQWTTSPTKVSQAGDVLFCVRGSTTGRMNLSDRDYCIGRGLAAIRALRRADARFVFYAITDALPGLLSGVTGSVFPNLSSKQISGASVAIPPPDRREAIAEVLGALDDKIAANTELLRASRGLRSTALRAALRPAPVRVSLGRATVLLGRGKAPRYSEGDAAAWAINQKCVRDGVVSIDQARGAEVMREPRLEVGDTLVNSTGQGTLGRVGIWREKHDAFPDSHVTLLRFDARVVDPWVGAEAAMAAEAAIEALGEGSTGQTELSRKILADFEIEVPPAAAQPELGRQLAQLHRREHQAIDESRRLAELRDTLLPHLMSGRLSVRDAEAQVEAVL